MISTDSAFSVNEILMTKCRALTKCILFLSADGCLKKFRSVVIFKIFSEL